MNSEILNNTLNSFLTAFSAGWTNIQPTINWLVGTMLVIEFVLLGFWWALSGGAQLVVIMKKLLYLGFWMWVVTNFPFLAKSFVFSLAKSGEIAGGAPGNQNILLDPSGIINLGFEFTAPLAKAIGEQGWDIADGLTYAIMWLLSILAFVIMAWQMFYAVLEFYLVLTLVGILLPFGFFEPTKFLAEKSIGSVISSGVKLMVLSFIVAVSTTILRGMTIPADIPSLETGITLVMVAGGIAFLAWNAPNVASGLLSGSPSLSAQTAVQTAGTAAAIGAAGASGVMAATRAAASAVGGSIRMASAAKTGAQIGSGTAKMAGAGPVGRAAAGVGGAGMAVGKSIWNRTGGKVADFVRGHYAGGAKDAFRATGGRLRSSGEGRSSTAKPRWADAAMSSLRRASELDPSKGGDTTP
ncbi:P-type conjugative transfer protein TrbL [Prosthecochloris sp. ZM_2]|uniref:P-type conjugative transfer protein TrbL n=1 Tax=Prosthecochloris sp. ZM_2 TaxID=2045206 RepID=UPI000DF7EAEE|nr:P-type conjugative transfer protein TrbL [Prosthecochloris sp. ZM_2]RNA64502.1 P-type conjugative transfer protein TrbL [Prosthecochloris sp. ZM_2]